jgi:hypothetical protein
VKRPLTFIILQLLLAAVAMSQTPVASPAAPLPASKPAAPAGVLAPAKPTAFFRVIGMDYAPDGLLYQLGSNAVSLNVPVGVRSMPLGYSGANPLVFFREVNGADGRKSNQPVLSVDLSGAGSLPLLVFHKPVSPTTPPVVTVYAEDASALPAGTVRILNEGTKPLVAKVGGKPLAVPPRGLKDQAGMQDVFEVSISSSGPKGEEILFNSNVGIVPRARIVFLVGPQPKDGSPVQIQRLLDGTPAP